MRFSTRVAVSVLSCHSGSTMVSTSCVSMALIGRSPIAGSTYLSSELRHWRAWSADFQALSCPATYCFAAAAKVTGSRAGRLASRASIGSMPSRSNRRCSVAFSRASAKPTKGKGPSPISRVRPASVNRRYHDREPFGPT
jgi:hypothetical protein